MPKNQLFPPEGVSPAICPTLSQLREALDTGAVLEGLVQRCDADQTLHLPLGSVQGRIPRQEVTAPWISGAQRDIAILSRVGTTACFTVQALSADERGAPVALLSRRAVQEQTMDWFLAHLQPGDVLSCRVTRLEAFGAFLDIGRGVIAMLPLEFLSVSRIPHTNVRLREGQTLLAAVRSIDPDRRRITMTLKELLGTWMENASRFAPGETVRGVVRSVMEYGSFIELAPNLSGLAESRDGLKSGDGVAVYIKSIRPERMKIKLQVIRKLPTPEIEPLRYQITDGSIDRWVYSPRNYEKAPVQTIFKAACP